MPSSLSHLSNHDLVSNLRRLVSDERRQLVEILEHLGEVERRRLHLEMGFSSIYAYCVHGLRYSRSAADRRIVTARALRRFPEIGGLLSSGDAGLTTVSIVARLLTSANGHMMLKRIRGRSQREVERIVDEYRPEARTRDRVRTVSVRERVDPAPAAESAPVQATPGAGSKSRRLPANTCNGDPASGPTTARADSTRDDMSGIPAPTPSDARAVDAEPPIGDPPLVSIVQKHEIRFIAGKDFMKKLQRMKALLSNRTPHATFEHVFEAAMDCYLEQHCPVRRHERRNAAGRKTAKSTERRNSGAGSAAVMAGSAAAGVESTPVKAGSAAAGAESTPVRVRSAAAGAESIPGSLPAPGVTPTRHIPAAVRDAVYARDGGRCTFVGPGGRRCSARHHLQIDHIVPYACGGRHEPSNLRLLCRAHNLLAAEHAFGRETMSRYARLE